MRSREKVGLHIPRNIVDIPVNKNFQILLTPGLHRLADDPNENHNYPTCLFIL